MLVRKQGNLFESGLQTLTVPVNMQGVMGAGLARDFAKLYPELVPAYRRAIALEHLQLGRPALVSVDKDKPNFLLWATKDRWAEPSQINWIIQGLTALSYYVETKRITSLAVPALGCGLGELSFDDVLKVVQPIFQSLSIPVWLYDPVG